MISRMARSGIRTARRPTFTNSIRLVQIQNRTVDSSTARSFAAAGTLCNVIRCLPLSSSMEPDVLLSSDVCALLSRMSIVEHVLVPAWADRISVERQGEDLIVRGEHRSVAPTPVRQAASTDLLRDYMEYAAMARRPRRRVTELMHLEFANAADDSKLTAFVRRFGCVAASCLTTSRRDAATECVEAVQNIDGLRRDRCLFAGALALSVALRLRSDARRNQLVAALSEVVSAIYMRGPRGELQTTSEVPSVGWYGDRLIPRFEAVLLSHPRMSTHLPADAPYAAKLACFDSRVLHSLAQVVLCELVNHFPPRMVPVGKVLMELPAYSPSGVLPLLYFVLRHDSLRGFGVEICARSDCGKFFQIRRSGSSFCSPLCSRLQRQRDYWHRQGKQRREHRNLKAGAPRRRS